MTEFKECIDNLIKGYEISYQDIVDFLEDNEWFNSRPTISDDVVLLTKEQQSLYGPPLLFYIENYDKPKYGLLLHLLTDKFNVTAERIEEFFNTINATDETRFYICDFLLYHLKKDVFLMSDKEITLLVEKAVNDLIKAHGDIFTFFLSWQKANYKTSYSNEYVMTSRYQMEYKKEAYDIDEYTELLYYLYNDDYITENEMYYKASMSKNYADTWLYLAIHFICSLRYTDLIRIPHPVLTNTPEMVLEQIREGKFSDKDARLTLLSVTHRLCLLPLTPNKTSHHSNIPAIKFIVPESCEVHLGILFALCEAHRCIAKIPNEEPLIRKISDYERISRYMGDEIGSLFLRANFRSRSANKSYLQAIYMLSDDILESEYEGPNVKGYILTALARSHKGSYGEFAHTTALYLKDARFNGLTPEFVAKELFERGVLSFIPSMLLKIITDGEYSKLPPSKQTEMIQLLDMTPYEIENAVGVISKARKQAEITVKELIGQNTSNDTILDILHRIATGNAFSKQPECLCLLSAVKKVCPYDERRQCVGCKYEIGTKSTLFLLVDEYNRIFNLFNQIKNDKEKNKYKKLLTDVILPQLDELLVLIKEQYGEEVYRDYERIIKENTI